VAVSVIDWSRVQRLAVELQDALKLPRLTAGTLEININQGAVSSARPIPAPVRRPKVDNQGVGA
jgi:hypothetical protein